MYIDHGWFGIISIMASSMTGNETTAQPQNLRLMSASSGLASSFTDTFWASSAMPQTGHGPGWSATASGCMGQR